MSKRGDPNKPRPLVKRAAGGESARKAGKGKRGSAAALEARRRFVDLLLDRGATYRQVVDALMRAKSDEPGKPGGLALTLKQAEYALQDAKEQRGLRFREESRDARAEQSARLRGHIAGGVASKQYGAVASLEKVYMDLHGTKALAPIAPKEERHEQIAAVLARMTPERIRELAEARRRRAAGEDGSKEYDDE